MASFLPVSLVGDNLGQRHRYLNSLVHEAKESGASVQDIEALPEESAVDRLFKINLAIELKHVDYIIRNLKDDDMLYVSRALKATWLIDHRDIINPKYLEDVLFPEMISSAVTKMKHWLYINLRDFARCQEFYQHCKENSFEFAIKFLSHCSHEFILEEAPKILTKLSPHSLKVLCEKCPRVAKIYFDSFATEEDVKTRYLGQDRSYYNSVKCVLKSDAYVFLDITENYFNTNSFSRFSPLATDYILRCHKTRFTNKLELYVAYFLHIPTLAARLSVEECQEVVVKLARASYLQHWFQYKVVEPLIKRLSPDKRAAFKKRVFVDKDVGDSEDKWPYEIPAPPVHSDLGQHIFDDQDFMCGISPIYQCQAPAGGMLFGASASMCAVQPQALNYQNMQMNMIRVKTDLDRLFDEFRFIGFERALHELGQRLVATASPDRRRDIFIVLVSKTGGRTDAVAALLRLTARYINEPPHTRAAILRSLVKRAKVWRLPADIWQLLLDYGHGLGLDGTTAEAACREGLHAVVIRRLLAGECEPAIRDAFMNDFSTLKEYSLKVDEKERVTNGLQNMLAAAATHDEPAIAANRLWQLLDVLKIYRIRVEPTSPAVKAVTALALRDAASAGPLLERLYNERIARRELLRYNMEFRRDEAALLNALRHDPSVLELKRVVDTMTIMNYWERNFHRFVPRPKLFDRFAAPRTGFTFGKSAPPPNCNSFGSTGFRFDSSATPVTDFRFGNSTSPPTDVSSSATPPTGYRFDSSAAPPASSFAATPTDASASPTDGDSYAVPSTGFCFGGSTVPQTNACSSEVPSTSFSSAAQSIDNSSSAAPPIGLGFGSSVVLPSDVESSTVPLIDLSFGSSTSQLTVVGSSAVPHIGFRFGSSAVPPINVGSSTMPSTRFSFGNSTSQLTDVVTSALPHTGFRFGSSPAAPTDVGSSATEPSNNGNSAVSPLTEIGSSTNLPTVDSNSVDQPMGFGSSAGYFVPPLDVDGSAAHSTDVGSSANLTTAKSNSADQSMGFGGSASQQTGFNSTAPQPTGFGISAPQRTGFSSTAPQSPGFSTSVPKPTGFTSTAPQPTGFGNSAPQQTGFGSSTLQPTGFGSSTPQPTGFGRSTPQPTGFGSSAPQPTGFGSSAPQLTGFGSTFPQPTGLGSTAPQQTGFGSSAPQPTGYGSSALQSTGYGSFAPQPTGFGSSAPQLTGFGSTAPQPTSFGSTAPQPTGFGSSVPQPTGFGSSTPQPTGFGSSTPQRTGFGSTAPQPTGFGSTAPQPTGFGSSAPQQTGFGSSALQPMGCGSSVPQPTGFGSSAPQQTGFGSSALQPMGCGSSAPQPTGFGSSAPQLTGFGSTAPQPTGFGSTAPQATGFGSSVPQPTGFGSSTPQPTSFGSSTPQRMHFGSSVNQQMGFGGSISQSMFFGIPASQTGIGRNSYRPSHFRRFGTRRANFDRFTSKLVIYYDQKQDFTTDLRTALKKIFAQELNVRLARSLASLLGNNFEEELRDFDAPGNINKKFAGALRACAHRARPVVNLAEWGWRKAGVKAVATRAMRCREIERDDLTRALAAEKRTVRVALALSMRSTSGLFVETFISTAKLRPAVALLAALPYFRRHGISSDLRVWDIVKPLISSINLEFRERLRRLLGNTDWIPATIKPDYCITLYLALFKISRYNAQMLLRDLSKLLPKCDECIENILLQMLDDDADNDIIAIPYTTIFVRFLLLSENEEDVERRFMKIGNRFFERLDTLRRESNYNFQRSLNQILESLKYNAAFLDSKYTSCLSVIERILAWTQTFMPKEEYFENYVHIHSTILYFKAVRESMKQMPEVFADPKRRKSEGVEAVGLVFGRYIVTEVADLVSTYFDSIIDLYTYGLIKYLSCNLIYGTSRNIFIGFMLKGFLTEAVGIQRRVAVYVLRDNQIVIEDSVRKEIEEVIMKDRALQFFAHAELFSHFPVVPYHHNLYRRN